VRCASSRFSSASCRDECSAARGPWICSPRRCGRCCRDTDFRPRFFRSSFCGRCRGAIAPLTTDIVKQSARLADRRQPRQSMAALKRRSTCWLCISRGRVKRRAMRFRRRWSAIWLPQSWLSQSARGCRLTLQRFELTNTFEGRACRPAPVLASIALPGASPDRRTDFPAPWAASNGSIQSIGPSRAIRRHRASEPAMAPATLLPRIAPEV